MSYLYYDNTSNKGFREKRDIVLANLDCDPRTLSSYIRLFNESAIKNKSFLQKQITGFEPGFSIQNLLKEKEKLLTEGSLYPGNRYSQESRNIAKTSSTVIALSHTYFEAAKKHEKRFLFTKSQIGEFLNQRIYKEQHRYLL